MAEFVSDASDENRIVFAERDFPVFAILNKGFRFGKVESVEFWGVELPCDSPAGTAVRVVGAFVGECIRVRIPVREVGKDHDRFPVRIEACFAENGPTFFADAFALGFCVVVEVAFADGFVEDDGSICGVVEVEGFATEAVLLHFIGVKVLDMFQDSLEAFAVGGSEFAIDRSPADDMQLSLVLFFRVPFMVRVENGEGLFGNDGIVLIVRKYSRSEEEEGNCRADFQNGGDQFWRNWNEISSTLFQAFRLSARWIR